MQCVNNDSLEDLKSEANVSRYCRFTAARTVESKARLGWWKHSVITALFLLTGITVVGAVGCSGPARNATETTTTPTSSPASHVSSADQDLKQLQERRLSARPSESDEIISAFSDAEKKHPNDYRFPYERAKLSIKGIVSHHEAFSALFLAGERAIDSGKAQEMLENLMADKDGDFYKVSRGHHEWQVLVQALSNKNKAALKAQPH